MMERIKRYDKTLMISSSDSEGIKDCAEHLRAGEVIGFPTETVYGLGADATDADAVRKIFDAKGSYSLNCFYHLTTCNPSASPYTHPLAKITTSDL